MNSHIFREYDVRGVVGKDLNEETVYSLARAIGTYFRRNGAKRISLGRDARISSPEFRDIMVRGLTESGCDCVDAGMIPTPVLYFTLFNWEVDGGIMITGSHNPADNNGFKICLGKSSIYGEQIQQIRKIAEARDFIEDGKGSFEQREVLEDYRKYITSNIKFGERKLKVVVDGGNGMGGFVAAPIYRELGCDVIELFCEPDGRFPNHHPDPTVVENMRFAIEAVLDNAADLAIAFDGDGDRIGVVDEKGKIIWGDQLMVIFARAILKERPGATFISEVKCSQTLFDDIKRHGGQAIMWKAGHSLIKAKMKETGAVMAAEMSGHVFFADRYFGYDDAIYAGARLLEILSQQDLKISALIEDLPKTVYTPEIRIDCPEDKKFDVVKRLTEEFKKTNDVITVDGARVIFPHGWGLVRASNTQPVLVLRFEADTEEHLNEIRTMVEEKLKALI
ncbi:MAG: phosphomannomutase/phosphoglucomutase [Pyrinomonadaceae bacterium]|nr:phosphomannomutase/phosphoglucomutase [Pyrinomonadaceae bacterium]MCX7640972.1 phosphomannomutase/phosphoglucomutase [Pyrinomonadaceae bacterium]MDW8305105.1 phosphomannomutase/phosphoglucomutase [Acidobacteriota bacterium]